MKKDETTPSLCIGFIDTEYLPYPYEAAVRYSAAEYEYPELVDVLMVRPIRLSEKDTFDGVKIQSKHEPFDQFESMTSEELKQSRES